MGGRGQLLHELDEASADVIACNGRYQAERDLAALLLVAEAIVRAIAEWRRLTHGCEYLADWDLPRSGRLILETVFDELLPAPHWRFLAAALALTWQGDQA
jgi:hypothetical protein